MNKFFPLYDTHRLCILYLYQSDLDRLHNLRNLQIDYIPHHLYGRLVVIHLDYKHLIYQRLVVVHLNYERVNYLRTRYVHVVWNEATVLAKVYYYWLFIFYYYIIIFSYAKHDSELSHVKMSLESSELKK